MELQLATKAKITWCPGCPNGGIVVAFREALTDLVNDGKLKIENAVALSGIGCHGKITDYMNINTFTSLHGRLIPTMEGIKIANPALTVVGFSGDGDSYAEGVGHLVHVARRNADVNLFIHDNQIFALTTGQATPTTPLGFKGKSTPYGSIEPPLNPLLFILSAGATFVARTYALDIAKTKEIMKAAIAHKGFSFVDILQPCLSFFDTRDYFKDRIEWLDENEPKDDLARAIANAQRGGLPGNRDEKVPLGVFYRKEQPTFGEQLYAE